MKKNTWKVIAGITAGLAISIVVFVMASLSGYVLIEMKGLPITETVANVFGAVFSLYVGFCFAVGFTRILLSIGN